MTNPSERTTANARIAAVGVASWDRFLVVRRYPQPGEYEIVTDQPALPGGTTTNSAVALGRLGAHVSLAALIGDDPEGMRLRTTLSNEPGIDLTWLNVRAGEPTDVSTIIVSHEPAERTILWSPGARLARRDRLDLTAIFDHDVVLFDVADHPLRQWISDLPAHFAPRTRMLATLTYAVDARGPMAPDVWDVMRRFDVLVGGESEYRALTGTSSLDALTQAMQRGMVGANLRTAVISRGAAGCRVCTQHEIIDVPAFQVHVADPTGAGDAFAGGIAFGMAQRWPWQRTARLANAVGALATRRLGAQASLPTRSEVADLMGVSVAEVFDR